MAERSVSVFAGGLAELGVARTEGDSGQLEPVPVPACDVCESCSRERESARRAGRSLEVRSLNGVIAGHPHGREAPA